MLRAQPLATGSVQDNQFSVGFTPGATTVSLLGLSPSFTLILIDGRPLADYPLLYNGQSNFTDLSSIPTAMIERIDILPGNQSAIYGSSAIAGVVNIILKQHIEGMQLGIRWGEYGDGGGENLRFQFTGGHQFGNLDLTWGLQYSKQDPIWGYDRNWYDSTEDNPDSSLRFGSRTFLILDGFSGTYIDPGSQCDNVADNFGGTTFREFRPGRGFYCGSRSEPGYTTFLNEEKGVSAYLNGTWQLGESELYASLLYGVNETQSNGGSRFWSPDINGSGGYIWEEDGVGGSRGVQLRLPAQPVPAHLLAGRNRRAEQLHHRSHSYNFVLGWRGAFGDPWDYDAYYNRSQYNITDSQPWPLTDEIEDFFRDQFLGPQMGTYYGYPIYQPDQSAFYQSLTPEQYASFLGNIGRLDHLDAQPQLPGHQHQPVHAAGRRRRHGGAGCRSAISPGTTRPIRGVIAGEFWGLTGTQGTGERENGRRRSSSASRCSACSRPTCRRATTTTRTSTPAATPRPPTSSASSCARSTPCWCAATTPPPSARRTWPTCSPATAASSPRSPTYFRCEEAGQDIDDCDFTACNFRAAAPATRT